MVWWALAGAAIVIFEAVILTKWVSGPYFTRVPSGPDSPPTWMKVTLTAWQVAGLFGVAFCYYWFLVRPWRRERKLTTDGMLVLACSTLWFQDPLSSYFGHWFTYNSYLVNYGSWVKEIPGWQSYGEPGAMIPEPIVLIGPVYVYFIMGATVLGCAVMRWSKRRWPNIRPYQQVAVCLVAMAVVDIVAEGLVWLPLGFWEYPGGIGFLFNDTYHKFPINELITICVMFTTICALRYFKDDRGQTLVERGVERLRIGVKRKALVRTLSIIAAVHLIMLLAYNVPHAFMGANSRPWPDDLQQRSYLTDNMCGPETDNLCPGNGHGFVEGGGSKPAR